MLDNLFVTLYEAMTGAVWIAVLASFGWGVLSLLLYRVTYRAFL